MAPTKQKEINPWDFVNNFEINKPFTLIGEDIAKAYRLTNYPQCTSCTRNCRKNPRCLWGLGEKKWLKGADEADFFQDDNDFRAEGEFVGLQNLGATCYLNSQLQLWYHSPLLPALLDWRPEFLIDEDNYYPTCPISHLQAIFAKMMLSKKKTIQPTELVEQLQLNTGEQQDAQEFSKLFLGLICNLLVSEKNQPIKRAISEAFEGECENETTCLKCEKINYRNEIFTEFELNVKIKLEFSLQDFFKTEHLDYENRYHCPTCGLQDATRITKLISLPPVLNLQIKRFAFDKNNMSRSKITTKMQFPDTMDFGEYFSSKVKPKAEERTYKLTAILIHDGTRLSSGHFTTLIKDPKTNNWYVFNDENVDIDKGRRNEENEKESSKAKKPYASDGAYMVVYTRKDCLGPKEDKEVPNYLKKLVDREDMVYEQEIQQSREMKDMEIQYKFRRCELINMIYSHLIDKNSNENTSSDKSEKSVKSTSTTTSKEILLENSDFISLDWLSSLLSSNDSNVEMIDNSKITCIHNKLKPIMGPGPTQYKILPSDVFEYLIDTYSIKDPETRFRGKEALCYQCVENECYQILNLEKLEKDYKMILDITKAIEQQQNQSNKGNNSKGAISKGASTSIATIDMDDTNWIGKDSLKKWKKLAKNKILEKSFLNKTKNERASYEKEDDDDEEEDGEFNSEIKCQHGKLVPDNSVRKLITREGWRIINSYFDSPNFFPFIASKECFNCLDSLKQNDAKTKEDKESALLQRTALPSLFSGLNRPKSSGTFYLMSSDWINAWRKYIKDPTKEINSSISSYLPLLCEHEKFLYPYEYFKMLASKRLEQSDWSLATCLESPEDVVSTLEAEKYIRITEIEWEFLRGFFHIKKNIKMVVSQTEGQKEFQYEYLPVICDECFINTFEEESTKLFKWNNKMIYIQKIQETIEDNEGSDDIEEIPPLKKEKRDNNQAESSNFVRRSARPRRQRGHRSYTISSDMKIQALKTKIYNDFRAFASDQHLFFNGVELDSSKTLEQLKIAPESTLQLKIDETFGKIDEPVEEGRAETGFQGTLLSSVSSFAPFNDATIRTN